MRWEDAWAEAHERSPLKVTAANEEAWTRFWSASAEQYLREVRQEESFYRRIVEHMYDTGWLESSDVVLDLGCGPGTYTLVLAEMARHVTGLDPSSGMIEVLRSEAQRRELLEIDCINARFEDAELGRDYDLVLSALSPAVRDATALRRMEACSRGRCAYITFGGGNEMATRNELWELLVGEYKPSDPYHIRYPFNILQQWDRKPILHRFQAEFCFDADPAKVIANYEVYFSIFTEMTTVKKRLLRRHIEERCQDGVFRKQYQRSLALLCWNAER